MDPDVASTWRTRAPEAIADPDERERERRALVDRVAEATSPYEAAGMMRVDEIIDPATTRAVLAADLARLSTRRVPPPEQRPLSYWSTC